MSPAKDIDKPTETVDEPKVEVSEDDIVTSDSVYIEHHERRWLKLFVYILMALAFAVLVVFAGRWIYHKVTHKKPQTTVQPAGNNTPQPPANTNNQTANNSSGSTGSNNGSSSSNSGSTSQSTPSELPNNGPGDVVALFLGTAAIVGGLHFVIDLRRGR